MAKREACRAACRPGSADAGHGGHFEIAIEIDQNLRESCATALRAFQPNLASQLQGLRAKLQPYIDSAATASDRQIRRTVIDQMLTAVGNGVKRRRRCTWRRAAW